MLNNLGRGELAISDSIDQPSRQVSDPFSSKQHIVLSQSAMFEVLLQALLEEIFNRLEYASFIASASCVCKSFKEAGERVRSLRLICLNEYHVMAREGGELHDTKGVSSSTSTAAVPSACSTDEEGSSSGDESSMVVFRDVVVDYGQQAIMRSIVKILSQNCKVLKTLDLRNMFIDSSELEDMPKLINITLRCVKVIDDALNYINARMQNLSTLALLGVFGVTHAHLDFPAMKVLCLGLSTAAKDVISKLPSLEKLQLKIMCSEKLTISAPRLKYAAFDLEVMDTCKVNLRNFHNLEEVLYGAPSFETLVSLVATDAKLKKLFLDIPCMALTEDGHFLGVLKGIPLNLPIFTNVLWCERLEVVNIGPGLWYTMEANLEQLSAVKSWPPFHRLILHMIPQNLETCLQILLKSNLYVWRCMFTPKVRYETIVRKFVSYWGRGIVFKSFRWPKSLNFSCFSFSWAGVACQSIFTGTTAEDRPVLQCGEKMRQLLFQQFPAGTPRGE